MTYLNYEMWHEAKSGWRWRLATVNGRVIARGAESYINKQDCLDAIDLVKGSAPAPVRQIATEQTWAGDEERGDSATES